jgi:hypothetical protein
MKLPMRLPKMFKNWVHFAAHCGNKFPNAETVKVDEEGKITVFSVETIKSNAFDEIKDGLLEKDSVLEVARIEPYLYQCNAKIILTLLNSLVNVD